MNQSAVSTGILLFPITPPITPTIIDSRFECSICGKLFRKSGGLTRHLNIVAKYNSLRPDLDTLPKGYKQLGKQTVSIPATESQFYAVFKNYIHYYSATRGIYKCVFRGGASNQILANILGMQGWEIKFYD